MASYGFWADQEPTSISRAGGRWFVGAACNATGNRLGQQNTWLNTDTDGAAWAVRDSQFCSMASTGLIAVSGFSRSGDQVDVPTECIGISGFVVNNKAGGAAWALYADVQHESGAGWSAGLEIAAKNKGSNLTSTPYAIANGVKGLWLAAGGDNAYGGAPANPSDTAITVLKNDHTWNKGVIFIKDALTGCDGNTGTAVAIEMAKGHMVRWLGPTGIQGLTIRSDVSVKGNDIQLIANDAGWSVLGGSGTKTLFSVDGSGTPTFGTYTIGAVVANGYITVKDVAGNTRKLLTA